MAHTSLHLPDSLRNKLDREAKRRGISRNQLVIDVLRRALKDEADDWPEWLFPALNESALGDP